MTRIDPTLRPIRQIQQSGRATDQTLRVEVFVSTGYCELEVASISQTLLTANEILQRDAFSCHYVSATAGLVTSRGGQMLRAEPAIENHGYGDLMIVVGGAKITAEDWLPRVRAMQKQARSVALLSDAATSYIQATKKVSGNLTTHWRDIEALRETGYYPNLTERLAEQASGIITAAGSASTAELMIGLISSHLDQTQIAELANLLLLSTIRKSDADQPKDVAGNAALFDRRVTEVIRLMEAHIADPIDMPTLTKMVGLSSRQVERVFREVFDQSPGKFYKQLRTKKAWALIEETLVPLADIAAATGFGSLNTMSKAVRAAYGISPAQSRARKSVSLMKFSNG